MGTSKIITAKRRPYFRLLLLCLVVVEVYSVLPLQKMEVKTHPALPQFKSGIIHVHSIFSDGGGTIPEIALAASKAGIDFVVVTDHNSSEARRLGFEKNYDGVDIFVEMEASVSAGHLLTFYSHSKLRDRDDKTIKDLAWKHYLEKSQPGMFTVVAHPSNIKNPWTHLDKFPDGVEVINFDSIWQQQARDTFLDFGLTIAVLPWNNFLAALRFFEPNSKDFIAWDAMNSVSPGHFGILAHDTHAKLKLTPGFSLRWPDYKPTFRLASNVVFHSGPLPSEFDERKKILYQSLKKGRSAMVFSIFPYSGNDWRLECTGIYRSGDIVTGMKHPCEFVVETPKDFPYTRIFRLWRNGELVREEESSSEIERFPVERTGSYRMEVWAKVHTAMHFLLHRPTPYVIYNPITIK